MRYFMVNLNILDLPLVIGDQCQLTIREISQGAYLDYEGCEPFTPGINTLRSGDTIMIGSKKRYFRVNITSCCL